MSRRRTIRKIDIVNKLSDKEFVIDLIKGFLATLLMGLGITLFISCELGSDPVTVFLDGVNRTTGIEVSIIDQAISVGLLVIAIFVNRKLIGVNTIINVLILGICIQIPMQIISLLNIAEKTVQIRFIIMLVGQIFLATSFAWMQTFTYGVNVVDAVFFAIMERFHVKYRVVKIIYDAIFITIGWLLGGIVGIGTIFSLLLNGFLTEKIRKIIDCVNYEEREGC